MDGLEELGASGPADLGPGQTRVVEPVGATDEDDEVLELLGAVRREDHVPVARRFDGRHFDGATGAAQRRPTGETGEDGRIGGERDRHAVEHGHVDVAATAVAGGGERGHGGVRPGQPLADAAAGRQWRAFGRASAAHRSARRLEGELRGRAVRPGSVRTEGRDRHRDKVGVVPMEARGLVGTVGQDDVGARRMVGVVARDRSLRRVQVLEETRARAPHRVAPGPLHLHHVRTGVGQELRAVGAGDAGGPVKDAQVDHITGSAYGSEMSPPASWKTTRSSMSTWRSSTRQPTTAAMSHHSSSMATIAGT